MHASHHYSKRNSRVKHHAFIAYTWHHLDPHDGSSDVDSYLHHGCNMSKANKDKWSLEVCLDDYNGNYGAFVGESSMTAALKGSKDVTVKFIDAAE